MKVIVKKIWRYATLCICVVACCCVFLLAENVFAGDPCKLCCDAKSFAGRDKLPKMSECERCEFTDNVRHNISKNCCFRYLLFIYDKNQERLISRSECSSYDINTSKSD